MDLVALTRMPRQHVWTALKALNRAGVVVRAGGYDGLALRVIADESTWILTQTQSAREWKLLVEGLERLNGAEQGELPAMPERERELSELLSELSTRAATTGEGSHNAVLLSELSTVSASGLPTTAKPEPSGNSAIMDRSRNGTGPETGPLDRSRNGTGVPAHSTVFKALKGSAVKSYETAEALKGGGVEGDTGDTLDATPRGRGFAIPRAKAGIFELRREVEAAVGKDTWTHWGGAWTNALKRDAELVGRVLAEFRAQVKEGRQISNAGGYMWDLLKRWTQPKPRS
jgi:hypothetical protein